MRWWLAPLVVLAGCGRCAQPTSNVEGGADASVDAQQDAPVEGSTVDANVDAAAATITPEQMRRYTDALTRGRMLTVQKKYAEAIAAFDAALVALPHDARATSERGYAKLLSGDTSAAQMDFVRALLTIPRQDKKLRAQVYFNLGLVNEKEGDKEEAEAEFRTSYEYNPTPQAKAKMSTCPVNVEAVSTEPFATRKAALDKKSLTADGDEATDLGCDDDACYAILPVTSGVVAVNLGTGVARRPINFDPGATATVKKDGAMWTVELAGKMCGRLCGCSVAMCGPNETDRCSAECKDAGATDFSCGSLECVDDPPRRRIWIDASSGAGLWDATWDVAFASQIETKVEDKKLHVTGAGCTIARAPMQAD